MAGDIIGSAYIEVLPITAGFQNALNAQLQRTVATGGIKVPVTANTSTLQQSIAKALPPTGHMLKISANTKPLEDAVTSAISSLTRKAMGIVGIVSIGSMIISHLKDAIYGFNNVIQQARIGLETLLGSAQEADQMIEDLKVFARSTPFQFQDLVKNTQTLIAMGTAGKDVIPTLTAVGDALSGLGRMSSLPRILFDLGQIRATGRLTGRELMNMAMQGIPVLKYLSEATGRTQAELREQMAKGSRSANGLVIDSETAITAILSGMENQFGGLMQRQMGTAAGAISNWKDAEQQLLGAMGKPIFDKIIESTVGVSKVVSDMAKAFADAGVKGESGMLAVKNVFLDLFPESARATINSVLGNLGKMLHDFMDILKNVLETVKEWGSYIAGTLIKSLQGLLNIIAPLTDLIAKHKTIVQDLIKAYIALKIIGVLHLMWDELNKAVDMAISKTIGFTMATRLSTVQIKENTYWLQLQRQALANSAAASGVGAVAKGQTWPAPTGPMANAAAFGVGPTPIALNAAQGRWSALGAAFATTSAKFKTGGIIAAIGLTALKTQFDKTNEAAQTLITVGQGAAAGTAILPGIGTMVGAAIGGLMSITNAMHQASEEAKTYAEDVHKYVDSVIADWLHMEEIQHGTGLESQLLLIKDNADAIVAATKVRDAATLALQNSKYAKPIGYDIGSSGDPNAPMTPENQALIDKGFIPQYDQSGDAKVGKTAEFEISQDDIDAHPELAKWKDQQKAAQAEIDSRTADNPDIAAVKQSIQDKMDILSAQTLHPGAIAKVLGLPVEVVKDMFVDQGGGHGGGPHGLRVKTPLELAASPESMSNYSKVIGKVDELGLTSKDAFNTAVEGWNAFNDGAKEAAELLAKAVKAGQDWAKAQEDKFKIDTDVANVNLSLQDAFKKVVTDIRDGKTSVEDFVKSGKPMVGLLNDAGAAAVEYAANLKMTAVQQDLAGASAQQSIIQSMIDLWTSTGKSNTEIDYMLDSLGLLERHRKLTIQIDADTELARLALWKLIEDLDAANDGWASADLGGIMGLAGNSWEPWKPPPVVEVPGANGRGYPTPDPEKEKKDAAGAADKAAKELESASKEFYNTIVEAAKSFHEKVMALMGSPTERIQFEQARSVGALVRNTDLRAAALTSWTEGIGKLKSEGLSQMAVDALGLMKGPEMDRQVKRLLQASPAELAKLNASITNEAQAAQKAAFQQQGDIIAKAITEALAKFFADSGVAPNGPSGIQITNNMTQSVIDYDAFALAMMAQIGAKAKIN